MQLTEHRVNDLSGYQVRAPRMDRLDSVALRKGSAKVAVIVACYGEARGVSNNDILC